MPLQRECYLGVSSLRAYICNVYITADWRYLGHTQVLVEVQFQLASYLAVKQAYEVRRLPKLVYWAYTGQADKKKDSSYS